MLSIQGLASTLGEMMSQAFRQPSNKGRYRSVSLCHSSFSISRTVQPNCSSVKSALIALHGLQAGTKLSISVQLGPGLDVVDEWATRNDRRMRASAGPRVGGVTSPAIY